jgi:hypothetical protein
MKLPIDTAKLAGLTGRTIRSMVSPAMYSYRTVNDATRSFAISHQATGDDAAKPSLVNGACDEIIRRYRNAGYTLEDAQEQAAIFRGRFAIVGDHAPESAQTADDPELDATLDRVTAVIG